MPDFNFTNSEKKNKLTVARNTLINLFDNTRTNEVVCSGSNLNKTCGIFVSLYNGNNLRGCIGCFESNRPLIETIADITISSAKNDKRFIPIKKNEINEINIEISILSPLEKINTPDELELGKHGVFIKKGYNRGTFLPQVANKTNWTKEEFISHCSYQKAHLGWDGWKTADLYRYEAIIINESDFR